MSPEVIRAKLRLLQQVLLDLKPHVATSRSKKEEAHYEIERQVQLAVDLCVAIGRRMLLVHDDPVPETSRQVFILLAEKKRISKPLGKSLADAVGLRNLIVHEYGVLDYDQFFGGLGRGFTAFARFAEIAVKIEKK